MRVFENLDCMEGMERYTDNFFDLAIVDPPYFSGPDKLGYYGAQASSTMVKRQGYKKIGKWKIPEQAYYDELLRVSKHQIIWGINYFDFQGVPSGRIIWDKIKDYTTFSPCEIASNSLIEHIRIFRYMWNGMLQGKSIKDGTIAQGNKSLNEKRIHPTQKPVNLYKWLLINFASPGAKILDTHVGSASSLIACEEMGFEYVGFEKDPEIYSLARDRIKKYGEQLKLPF